MATLAAPVAVPARGATVLPPILWPCGAILLGSALGPTDHDRWPVTLALAVVTLALALIARTGALWSAAFGMLAFAGSLWHSAPPSVRPLTWTTEPVNAVRGIVETWPTAHAEMVQAPVRVVAARTERGWQPADATLNATLPSYPPLQRGDLIVAGGITTVRPGWWRDADGSLYGQWIRLEQREDATTAEDYRHRIVARLIAEIDRNVRPPESGLTAGMLLGEKTVLDEQTRDALNSTGTSQHVVISGWNLALVIGLFAALARYTPMGRRVLWSVATLGTVALYTFAVGAELSVVRAALMGAGALVAPLVGRRADPLVWLGIASAAMVIHDPAAIRDLSFLLSCAATFGVLVVAPWLAGQALRAPICAAFPRVTELLAVAVGAQLMTEPLILHTFGRVSLISPIVNMIVEPTVPIIMALGGITGLLGLLPFSLPATVAGTCTALPAALFLGIINHAGNIPLGAIQLPQPGVTLTALIYAVPAIIAFWFGQVRLRIGEVRLALLARPSPFIARGLREIAAGFAITLALVIALAHLIA